MPNDTSLFDSLHSYREDVLGRYDCIRAIIQSKDGRREMLDTDQIRDLRKVFVSKEHSDQYAHAYLRLIDEALEAYKSYETSGDTQPMRQFRAKRFETSAELEAIDFVEQRQSLDQIRAKLQDEITRRTDGIEKDLDRMQPTSSVRQYIDGYIIGLEICLQILQNKINSQGN